METEIISTKKRVKRTPAGRIKKTFPVLEMTCAACAISVESMLKSARGVKDAGVNFANQSAWVEYDPSTTTDLSLQAAVRSVGYDLVIDTENLEELKQQSADRHYHELKMRTIWSSALAAPIVIIGMFFMNMPYANWIMMALATPVVAWFGRRFFINGWKQARHGRANMDTLVALSTGIAYLFSAFNTIYPAFWHARGLHAHVYFEAAAVIIAFISLGKLLEEKAKSNTSTAIKKLMRLQPDTVNRVSAEGQVQTVPLSSVNAGDLLLVKPGERIPVDGKLTSGESFVDESMINGEPIPLSKKTGDEVFAGTINQKGSFYFKAAKVGADTLLAQIIRMVQEAQGSKAPVQKLVDRIAGIFVPMVIGIAVLTFGVWMVSGVDNAFTHALLTAVTVLVIACPCALGLATPTAIMVGIGKGAEHNILIKDAQSLELAHRVDTVVLDKTGTITEGKPTVTDLYIDPELDTAYYHQLLLSIESQSEHPLAEAIVNYLRQGSAQALPLASIQSIPGQGVKAVYQHKTFLVGNDRLMQVSGVQIDASMQKLIAAWQAQAKTVVLFAENQSLAGLVAIADRIKPGSKAAVETLKRSGIAVYMLTGDNKHTAAAIAAEAGVDQFEAEVMPAGKAAFIQKLKAQGKTVAMAGDGINDSQALAEADVSMAMGRGSDIAMDVAAMTLTSSDLNTIPKALKLSGQTVRTIRQNLFWAFIYNLVGIPLAAGVLYPFNGFSLNPMIAGAAMALSSVSVVANSLRLKAAKL